MSTPKYTTISDPETGLLRIVAARDIPRHELFKGDRGGLIESEQNLSHGGDAWVGVNARVYGNALVGDNARVGEGEVR